MDILNRVAVVSSAQTLLRGSCSLDQFGAAGLMANQYLTSTDADEEVVAAHRHRVVAQGR